MKNIILIILVISTMSFSCTDLPDGYTQYQTFNEYYLTGISVHEDSIKSPFIWLKQDNDIISIIVSNNKKDTIKYFNKGEYWYSIKKHQLNKSFINKTSTVPRYVEKYIFDGIILNYTYMLKNGIALGRNLNIETPSYRVYISLSDNVIIPENNKFNTLKEISKNYSKLYPYFSRDPNIVQLSYYKYYNKKFKNNLIFIYEKDSHKNFKIGCLVDIIKINSLGEFDIESGKSIIKEDQVDNECM